MCRGIPPPPHPHVKPKRTHMPNVKSPSGWWYVYTYFQRHFSRKSGNRQFPENDSNTYYVCWVIASRLASWLLRCVRYARIQRMGFRWIRYHMRHSSAHPAEAQSELLKYLERSRIWHIYLGFTLGVDNFCKLPFGTPCAVQRTFVEDVVLYNPSCIKCSVFFCIQYCNIM